MKSIFGSIQKNYDWNSVIELFKQQQCMRDPTYICTNCQAGFATQSDYKSHIKSQFHRYNIKRRLINLPPISLVIYEKQFDASCSESLSSCTYHCAPCSKKFNSQGTFQQHIRSHKHRLSLQQCPLLELDDSSFASLCQEECLFCPSPYSQSHLSLAHGFPPYQDECLDKYGLVCHVRELLKEKRCLYCDAVFESKKSLQQHMVDLGHCHFKTIDPFEQYYCWKQGDQYQTKTFAQIEEMRINRIQETEIGAIINGKEVGCRKYKIYYKQYLGRDMPQDKNQAKALENNQEWKNNKTVAQPQKTISKFIKKTNHR